MIQEYCVTVFGERREWFLAIPVGVESRWVNEPPEPPVEPRACTDYTI
jgi:hypothetical protein